MKGHPEIAKVRIEVYAEGLGQPETQKRAEAVRDFLVGKGVDAARLAPVGAGTGTSRVDFIIDAAGAAPARRARGRTPRAGRSAQPRRQPRRPDGSPARGSPRRTTPAAAPARLPPSPPAGACARQAHHPAAAPPAAHLRPPLRPRRA